MPGLLLAAVAMILVATLAPGEVRAASLTDNLLAWWGFEGGLADGSGHGRNLVLEDNSNVGGGGLPQIVADGVGGGQALRTAPVVLDSGLGPGFNPVPVASGFARHGNGAVDPLDFAGAASGFAVQAWVNLEQLTFAQGILFNRDVQTPNSQPPRNGWELHLGHQLTTGPDAGKNALQFITKTGFGAAIQFGAFVSLSTQSWHHIVFSSDGIYGTLYLNGVAIDTQAHGQLDPSAHDLYLGVVDANIFGVPLKLEPLAGRMDEVALWDRYLTPDEVTELYGGGQGLNNPQAVPEGGVSLALSGTLALIVACHRRRGPQLAQP